MKHKRLKLSICIPTYKGSNLLRGALDSIFNQNFDGDFEMIIGEDTPLEFYEEIKRTEMIIRSYQDTRIQYFKNQINLGYPKNLKEIVNMTRGDVIFLMAQDDILTQNSLQKTHDAFLFSNRIGCVTRPYCWFMDDVKKPVRAVTPYDQNRDRILSIFDGEKEFMKIFESLGQLSGLAYRRDLIEIPFGDEVFTAHIYPFAGILRSHPCVFLKDYTVAVGIKNSQTRFLSSIYDRSPTEVWLEMYRTVFSGEKFKQQRAWGIKHITTHYVGMIQLKNYSTLHILLREIRILINNRRHNLLSLKFWFFSLGCLVVPRFILRILVDGYKRWIYAKWIRSPMNF